MLSVIALSHSTMCHYVSIKLSINMLNVIMLSVNMLNVIMLSVNIMNVIMLSVNMLNVMLSVSDL